jgi:RNA polymerase sigma-70 factor (ECF subfamily)
MVRMIGPDADLDDLVQEALLIVVRRHADIRDPAALRSFVYGVAVRVCRNELRKRAIRRFIPWNDAPVDARAAPLRDPTLTDAVHRVQQALDKLDAELRIAFVLRFVEGYELAEGAKLAGCSLATYKRRLSRAQKRFHLIASRDPILARWLEEGERP